MAIEDLTTKGELERFILDRSGVDRLAAIVHAKPRIVRGEVNANGTIRLGTGYSIVKNGTGDYTINFSPAFNTVPVVVIGAGESGGAIGAKIFPTVPVTASSARLVMFATITGSPVDAVFEFIAVAS